MKKRLLSAVLAGVTAASMILSACGSTAETSSQTTAANGGEAAIGRGESDFSEHMVISLAHWDIDSSFAERD